MNAGRNRVCFQFPPTAFVVVLTASNKMSVPPKEDYTDDQPDSYNVYNVINRTNMYMSHFCGTRLDLIFYYSSMSLRGGFCFCFFLLPTDIHFWMLYRTDAKQNKLVTRGRVPSPFFVVLASA